MKREVINVSLFWFGFARFIHCCSKQKSKYTLPLIDSFSFLLFKSNPTPLESTFYCYYYYFVYSSSLLYIIISGRFCTFDYFSFIKADDDLSFSGITSEAHHRKREENKEKQITFPKVFPSFGTMPSFFFYVRIVGKHDHISILFYQFQRNARNPPF